MIDAGKVAQLAADIAQAEQALIVAQGELNRAKEAYGLKSTELSRLRGELTAAVHGQVFTTPEPQFVQMTSDPPSNIVSAAARLHDPQPHVMKMKPGIVRINPDGSQEAVVDSQPARKAVVRR